MPLPPQNLIERLGPEITPYERNPNREFYQVRKGEDFDFSQSCYNGTDNKTPKGAPILSFNQIKSLADKSLKGKYLWVIEGNGELKMLQEETANSSAERGVVCHTNITNGGKALQGGELWFSGENKMYYNHKSGRYGNPTEEQMEAVREYFQFVGYKNAQEIKPSDLI